MNTFGPPKLVLTRGKGAHVWDDGGKQYLDLLGGIAVNSLGHAHPALVEAVTTQLQTLGHVSNFFATEPQVRLAERLLALLSRGRDARPSDPARPTGKVFFTNSGTEANEAALKLTRRTGRTHLVATEGAFHGRTMGALALTSKAAYREPFEPLPGDVTFVPYGDADALADAVTDATAAVILEPLQGEAGVVAPPLLYLQQAREITARARRAAVARRDPDRDRSHRGVVRPPEPGRRLSPGRARRHRDRRQGTRRRVSRSVPASPPGRPPTCSDPATTAPPSAATRSRPLRRSRSWTRSRGTGCSSTSPRSATTSVTGWPGTTASPRSAAPGS